MSNPPPLTDAEIKEIDAMSFEGAMAELESIVKTLESGRSTLQESIHHYARGAALREHCGKLLDSAKMQVDLMMKNEDGGVTPQPFDAQPKSKV